MSQPNSAPHDLDSVVKYIKNMLQIPHIKSVWLRGSRSPTRDKAHRVDSDWDITFEVDRPLLLDRPRDSGVLHADITCVESQYIPHLFKAVEIYPTDEYNILKGKL